MRACVCAAYLVCLLPRTDWLPAAPVQLLLGHIFVDLLVGDALARHWFYFAALQWRRANPQTLTQREAANAALVRAEHAFAYEGERGVGFCAFFLPKSQPRAGHTREPDPTRAFFLTAGCVPMCTVHPRMHTIHHEHLGTLSLLSSSRSCEGGGTRGGQP